MIPTRIDPDATEERIASLAAQWKIDCALARRLHLMTKYLPFSISIFSGYRTTAQQRELELKGTGVPVDLSTHTTCPATGADIKPNIAVTDEVKRHMGHAAEFVAGLRWGGGAKRVNGIPVHPEWMHFDLGPR